MSEIPGNMTEVDEDWLFSLLQNDTKFETDKIVNINREPVGEGIGQSGEFNRVEVTSESGATTNYFLKLRAPLHGLHPVAMRYKMYEKEVRFYNELAAKMEVRTPNVLHADYDASEEKVVLLMEYMDGWSSPDQLTGASHQQTKAALKELTKISAPFWGRTQEVDWLPDFQADFLRETIGDMQACEAIFFDRFGEHLSISREDFSRMVASWSTILDKLSDGILTFTHYDYRVENLFFSQDAERVAVIDWQLIAAIRPSWDFAYLIGTNIATDDRRQHEKEYINLYLSELKARGIDYSESQLREDMKWTLLGISTIPVIGGANFDASNERSFELFKTIAQRHFETIADYDALSVI